MSEKFDILYDIDMQLYNEFNDTLCEINEHLGDIYSYKDKADVEDAEKSKERLLLREAVKKLQKELEQEKEKNKELEMELLQKDLDIYALKEDRRLACEEIAEHIKKEDYIPKNKIKDKIEELNKTIYNGKVPEFYAIYRYTADVLEELLEE